MCELEVQWLRVITQEITLALLCYEVVLGLAK
jgi:hypothetical protein